MLDFSLQLHRTTHHSARRRPLRAMLAKHDRRLCCDASDHHASATQCRWAYRSSIQEIPYRRRFRSRTCAPNTLGASTLADMLGALYSYQKSRHPASYMLREGSTSGNELESWLTIPSAAPAAVCETGFNAGTSAAAWLCSFPNATYVGFDLLATNASRDAAEFLRRAFPGRFDLVEGDTLTTLPRYAMQRPNTCDVMSVDGGHSLSVALSDLASFRRLARDPLRHVVLMDDLRCTQWWCRSPTDAW